MRQQQAGGPEPVSQNPNSARAESPRKQSWVAVADKDLPLSPYTWESVRCAPRARSQSRRGEGGRFACAPRGRDTCRCLPWGLKQCNALPYPQTLPSAQTNTPVHSHKGASPATVVALHALLSREVRVPEAPGEISQLLLRTGKAGEYF